MKKIDIVKREYNDFLNFYKDKYPNLPDHLFKDVSWDLSDLSELINIISTDIMYPQSRFAAYAFASRCDYTPTEADGATCTLTITLKSAMAKTLPVGYKVSGTSSISGESVIYELTAIGDSGGTNTITVDAKQQITYTNKSLGSISGTADWSKYWINNYLNIIKDSVSLVIGGNTYTRVDNFDASGPTDRNFILYYNSDGRCLFELGDGITGAKPNNNDAIFATFAISMGTLGKVASGDLNVNLDNDSDILSITNTASNGGNDSETVNSIIRNSQANVRLRDGIFTVQDVVTYAVSKSSLAAKIVKAHAIPGTGSSLGTANVDIITNDLVNLTPTEKTNLDAEMKAATFFSVIPIYSQDPNYLNATINVRVSALVGYDATLVRNLCKFALQLTSSPIDNYVIDYYQTYGIDQTRTNVINVTFGHTFTSAENSALSFIIDEWILLLHGLDGREYGMKLELADLYNMVNELYDYGFDEMIIDSPVTNLYPTVDQIIKGTVTVTAL